MHLTTLVAAVDVDLPLATSHWADTAVTLSTLGVNAARSLCVGAGPLLKAIPPGQDTHSTSDGARSLCVNAY